MAQSPLGNFADLSTYQRAAAQPNISPLDALIQGAQQGAAIVNLPQELQNKALNDQLARAVQMAKIQQLQQGSVENVGGRLIRYNPQTGKVDILVDAAAPNFQLAGFSPTGQPLSFDPRNNSLVVAKTPEGLNLSGPLQPKTTGPETFTTVNSDQGLFRVGNRSTVAAPLLSLGGENQTLQAPAKPANVKQFTDANGNLFQQPLTGGPATPVFDTNGVQINSGVANQVITTDQGVFTVPKKSGGTGEVAPVTSGGVPLTKTKIGSKESAETTKQFLNNLAETAISNIDSLEPRISNMTAGIGSLASRIPGTSAADFSADLRSLASDIRLGVLQEMKSQSKTGASGLGQLSNAEGKSLESALGSLEASQSPEQLKSNLKKVKASLERWRNGVQKFEVPSGEIPKKDSLGLFSE